LGFLRGRLSYANVVATVAVFIALGGSAAAAVIVSSNSEIAPNTVYGASLPAGKNDNIVGGSVGSSDLAGSAVINSKLATGAVGSGKLADKAVIAGKLGDGAVAQSNVASGAVGTSKLADGSVTLPKLGGDVIDRIDSHTGTASQFSGTQPVDTSSTVKTVVGVEVFIDCSSDSVVVTVRRTGSGLLDASGFASDVDVDQVNAEGVGGTVRGASHVNYDIIARNRAVGRFVHLDVHASASGGREGCPYWGVSQLAG
jgi:hypothetical protein